MGDKTNKLNICLIKNEHTRFNQIIDPDTTSFDIDGVGTFYMEDFIQRRRTGSRIFLVVV